MAALTTILGLPSIQAPVQHFAAVSGWQTRMQSLMEGEGQAANEKSKAQKKAAKKKRKANKQKKEGKVILPQDQGLDIAQICIGADLVGPSIKLA